MILYTFIILLEVTCELTRKGIYILYNTFSPVREPEHGTSAQHRQDMEAYKAYKRKDRVASIRMLSSVRNDLMLLFESNAQPWPTGTLLKYNYVVLQPLGWVG